MSAGREESADASILYEATKQLCPVRWYLGDEWWRRSSFSSANRTAQEIKRNTSQMEIPIVFVFYLPPVKVNKDLSAFRSRVAVFAKNIC